MRKSLILLLVALTSMASAGDWKPISSTTPAPAKVKLVTSTIDRSVVNFTLDGFFLQPVTTPRGEAYTVAVGEATPILENGAPDIPKMTASLVIPDAAGMDIRVVSSAYLDFQDITIAPSKGVILRTTDPATVPYTYGKSYNSDRFYPGMMADTREPYIARDLRGQTMIVYPFQYNPVTRTLRVHYNITVELYKATETGVNPLARKDPGIRIHPDFLGTYSSQFLNFDAVSYTPLEEYGKLLVICYGPFMSTMEPYMRWKTASGWHAEMVNVTAAGSTAAQIKSYIANYYNTNGLTHVLLVGDGPQIPTNTGSGLGGPSDNAYGYIVGNDHYSDVYIGRFSAENTAHVSTQVERTLNYEKNPQFLTDDWYTTVIGIASDQGPGDDGEYDYEHIRNQQTQLLAYTYTWNPELFDGSQGGNDAPGNPNPTQVATDVNNGAGLILYTGHGSQTSWGSSGFSNNNVNQLTNNGKLPFIWSVACVNGEFMNGTCFAEAWLRATKNGGPTGAIAFLGSTINQSWNSPMEGQDEMTDILAESYPGNIKRTFAGLSISGCMKMIDSYGTDGKNMADTWTVFGDPTIMVRSDNPTPLTVTHPPTLFVGATSLIVTCSTEGARVTATIADTILATGLVSGGNITLTFPALTNPVDSVHIVATAYNKIPYEADLPIITPNGPYILYLSNHVNDTTGNNNHAVDYNEDILLAVSVKNIGVAAASNLNVILRSNDPHITWSDTTENYGLVASGEQKQVADAFFFHTSNQVPDGHAISFQAIFNDGSQTWNGSFTLTAHAPVLQMASYILSDTAGNNNGRLDPGETAHLAVTLQNAGTADAAMVSGFLNAVSPWITVTQPVMPFGTLAAGQNSVQVYELQVDAAAPLGTIAPFVMEISAQYGIQVASPFSLVIGRIPALIVDFDVNHNSGPAMKQAIEDLDLPVTYLTELPDTLDQYQAIFVCLGTLPNNYVLPGSKGQRLSTYLDNGGRLYMEGGETWYSDPQTVVHPRFYIMGYNDGMADLGQVLGQTGTFTEGQSFFYNGDNADIDRLAVEGFAFSIFKNSNPTYGTAIAYDGGSYRTIGSSFEFGGLLDAAFPSTKKELMKRYLNFFGIDSPAFMANFSGFPTQITPGGMVSFTDYSTGGASSWSWSFPGGTPAASTEQNPVVTYGTPGNYDVTLITGNGTTTDTLVRTAYVEVDWATAAGSETSGASCRIMPNPSDGNLNITVSGLTDPSYTLTVSNLAGSVVYRSQGDARQGEFSRHIDLTQLDPGVYVVTVQSIDALITRKVVIRR